MKEPASDFWVVCFAGSAGGLQAYIDILQNLPPDTGMAFVFAPHRSLEQPELLPEILGRSTTMAVTQVETGTRLERDHVFVMPPGTRMTLDGNMFCLRKAPPPTGWPETINVFLYSLAEVKGPWAVAVILSGLDSDGSAALASIKAAGGVTFAQADPIVEDMPRSAVATGNVDFLLPSEEIARSLSALPRKPKQRR